MNKTIQPSKRFLTLDMIKVLSSFMVILYHLRIIDTHSIASSFYFPNISKILLGLCSMSVPLFFMVNGSLSIGKDKKFSYYMSKFAKIISLYIFWNMAFDIIYYSVGKNETFSFSFSATHLWFLATLSVLYIAAFFINKLLHLKPLIIAGCIFIFIYPFLYNYAVLGCRIANIQSTLPAERTGFFTLYSTLYYIIGSHLWRNQKTLNSKRFSVAIEIALVITGLLLVTAEVTLWTNINNDVFDGVNACFPTIGALLMSSGAFLLLCRLNNLSNPAVIKFYTFMSNHCLGIYILHPLAILLVKVFYNKPTNIIGGIILSSIVMLISLSVSYLAGKIPVIKNFFKV